MLVNTWYLGKNNYVRINSMFSDTGIILTESFNGYNNEYLFKCTDEIIIRIKKETVSIEYKENN